MSYERIVNKTDYEWDFESLDEHGDIIDHDFNETFPGLPTDANVNLVLVKSIAEGYNSDPASFDCKDRTWAYVKDGVLPAQFDDGSPVPKRFFKHFI